MPWRNLVSPYRTWISEIMLQQTTVAAVTPKFEAFLAHFPDIRSLARARETEVLKHWAGLGYYARARNLRRAAQKIVAEHGGAFPSDFDMVMDLPGIGRYTAGAILSIAFQKPYPVVDGNVIRVYSRLFALRGRAKDPKFVETVWSKAGELMPKRNPGDWNQALMDLGATVCTPESPACDRCPVSRYCAAKKLGLQDELPMPEPSRTATDVRWRMLWLRRGGEILLWKRSARERLLKNMWGLPEYGSVPATAGAKISEASHSITHHALRVELFEGVLTPGKKLPSEAKWVKSGRAKNLLVSSLWRKLLPAIS